MIRWDRTKGRPEPISALNKILELENGEPLVNILEYVPNAIILRPAVIPYLRKGVAVRLAKANESLPTGISFGVIDCFRTLARQQRIYDFMWNGAVERFQGRSHASLRRTVCRWVAPTNQKAPPGHCTGAAIDLQLMDAQGEMIDVYSPYDRYSAAPTYAYGLTKEAEANRMVLVEAMLGAGFSNCRDEWWHYSYGDAGWAVRAGETSCIYGLAELPDSLTAEAELLHAKQLEGRPNPFDSLPSG